MLADMIEEDVFSAFAGSSEAELLEEAVSVGGESAWLEIMMRLERGEWRLSFTTRAWLGTSIAVDIAERWVGGNVERGRVLANVTKPEGPDLPPTARYLLEAFPSDEPIQSLLAAQFTSGSWTGNESARINSQISDVKAWIAQPGQSAAVTKWAQRLTRDLESRHDDVKRHEDERDW
jgi:hypothetical protein